MMSSQILLLDRVEFGIIKVESRFGDFGQDASFAQLALEGDDIPFLTRSDLVYPPDQLDDPRYFMLTYGVKISQEHSPDQKLPYEVEVEATGFFRYVGGDEFKDERRFRAVRFSGYQILYGAIREMVSNLTARGKHGLWHLPARNFGGIAEVKANEDQARRQQAIADRDAAEPAPAVLPAPKKRGKKLTSKEAK